jgi:hypothetical protein
MLSLPNNLGLITNEAHFTLQPPLANDGPYAVVDGDFMQGTGCASCVLGAEPTPEESRRTRERAYAVLAFALAVTGVGVGAYVGSKKSREWSAGGAVIGMASAAIVSLLFKAAILPERVQ